MTAEQRVGPGLAWRWGVPLVAAVAALLVLVTDGNRALFDVVNAWPGVTGDTLWASLTILGGGSVAAACLLPFVGRRPDVVFAGFLVALSCYVTVESLKSSIDLSRPAVALPSDEVHVIGPALRKNTFPSGHTATAFALAGLLVLAVARSHGRVVLVALAALVGLSRIAVGMHWPLDVLVGAALGWVLAVGAVACAQRWSWGRVPAVQVVLGLAFLGSAVRIVLEQGRYPMVTDLRRALGAVAIVASLPGWWRLLGRGRKPGPEPKLRPKP